MNSYATKSLGTCRRGVRRGAGAAPTTFGGKLGKDFSLDCVNHLAPRANGKIALAAAPLALPAPNLQDPFLDHVCDCVTPVAAQTSTSQKNE